MRKAFITALDKMGALTSWGKLEKVRVCITALRMAESLCESCAGVRVDT